MRNLNLIRYDIKFQLKYGFYFAYFFVAIFYIIILRFLPNEYRNIAMQFIIFTDTSILGFMFVGGIILLEKSQRTLEFLFVSPVKISEYLISKVLSLSFMALIVSFFIVLLGYGLRFDPFLLILGILLSSSEIILLGIVIASHSKTINHYLLYFTLTFPLFIAPLLDIFNLAEHPIFYIFPTQCTYKLLEAAFNKSLNFIQILLIAIYSLTVIFLLYKLSYKQFYQKIILKVGDN